MPKENYEKLLGELCEKIKVLKPHSENYNILTVLGVDYKEVRICRLIGDLLNPRGAHGLGITPLKLFLDMLQKQSCVSYNYEDNELSNAYVSLEDRIDNDRRVDIAIYIGKTVIPIEAKIWAGDQDKQLFDYYNYYLCRGKSIEKIYYLTPNGSDPSPNSLGELKPENIYNLSFKDNIKEWLKDTINRIDNDTSKSENYSRVKSLIEQFIEVIDNMCKESKELEAIKELIDFKDENSQEKIKALNLLLLNSKEILKMIAQEYVKRYIILSDDYKYLDSFEKPEAFDSQMILQIGKIGNDSLKIWIGKDSGKLYIMTDTEVNEKDWASGHNYYWKYIINNNNKSISLNDMCFEDIYIENILNEIQVN